jgi:hypothetical protein
MLNGAHPRLSPPITTGHLEEQMYDIGPETWATILKWKFGTESSSKLFVEFSSWQGQLGIATPHAVIDS